MIKKSFGIVTAVLLGITFIYLLVMTIGDAYYMGLATPGLSFSLSEEKAIVSRDNKIEFQTGNSCSGYSSAYLLRHFGVQAKGDSLYAAIPDKGDMGYVSPKSIVEILNDNGLKAKYNMGNLNALKNEVAKGDPIIALLRYDNNHKWLHYVPIVGYSSDSIYIAESIPELSNVQGNRQYNRALSTEEFEELWDTSDWRMPLYRNTFISVSDSRP